MIKKYIDIDEEIRKLKKQYAREKRKTIKFCKIEIKRKQNENK